MKKLLLIILLIVGCVFAQQYEVVVILQNGSEIHGIIIEEKPNEYIKIQSGKNVFVFQMDEIELLTKELVKDISNKTWSFAVGLGTNRSFSLLGISKDFRIGNHFSLFVSADIPIAIINESGHALTGIGFTYQNNYNGKGFNITHTLGYQFYDGVDGDETYHGSINYQLKIGPQSFLSWGIMGGYYWNEDIYVYSSQNGISGMHHEYSIEHYMLPTISYDFRF